MVTGRPLLTPWAQQGSISLKAEGVGTKCKLKEGYNYTRPCQIHLASALRHRANIICLFFLDFGHDAVAIQYSIQFHMVSL